MGKQPFPLHGYDNRHCTCTLNRTILTRVLKRCAIALVCLSALAWAVKRDYVVLVDALTNQHKLVIIRVESFSPQGRSTYTLTCNQDEDHCRIPMKGVGYVLDNSSTQVYQCENVILRHPGDDNLGTYCLDGIE